jgi:hypothetical protein
LAFGVWRLAFGVWRLAFGVWRSAFGVRRLGVWLMRHGHMSRRDNLNVAWQFIAWKVRLEDPPRRVRCDGLPPAAPRSGVQVRFLLRTRRLCVPPALSFNRRPHRTLRGGITAVAFQAINCLATFILSLRDKARRRRRAARKKQTSGNWNQLPDITFSSKNQTEIISAEEATKPGRRFARCSVGRCNSS